MNQIVTHRAEHVTEVNWEMLAHRVESQIMDKLKNDLAKWPDDLSMRRMFVQDCADGLAVCECLLDGNWTAVRNRLWTMDTAAREWIYEFMESVAGTEFMDIMDQKYC